jgi:hypothetical protein
MQEDFEVVKSGNSWRVFHVPSGAESYVLSDELNEEAVLLGVIDSWVAYGGYDRLAITDDVVLSHLALIDLIPGRHINELIEIQTQLAGKACFDAVYFYSKRD